MPIMDSLLKALGGGGDKKPMMSNISPDKKTGSLIDKEDHKAWLDYKSGGGSASSKAEWIAKGKPGKDDE